MEISTLFYLTVAALTVVKSQLIFHDGPDSFSYQFFQRNDGGYLGPFFPQLPQAPNKPSCTYSSSSVECNQYAYRSFNGTCNNLVTPDWGAANTPYARLVPNRYADGIHAYPRSVSGQPLPQPRLVRRLLLPESNANGPKWTLLFMQWGQIMTHDMSFAKDTPTDADNPTCCSTRGPLFGKVSKGEFCSPPLISKDDELFVKFGQRCFDFQRTTTDANEGSCPAGVRGRPAKPLSAVTHWMDASLVYGNNDADARKLRSYQGGLLRVEVRDQQEWPPSAKNAEEAGGCLAAPPKQRCYVAGDARVNQNPGLAMLQIILLREHNRLARELSAINPKWDDERLYQESRRILIALVQHISYDEWNPAMQGIDVPVANTQNSKHKDEYDDRVNPNVLNEHAHAAFRFFHTDIKGMLLLLSEERETIGSLYLPGNMLNVSALEGRGLDDLARGHATQPQHPFDRFFDHEVVNNLFRNPNNSRVGFDLKVLDIQRDRDHGLGSYNDLRGYCGRMRAKVFSDFSDAMEPEVIEAVSRTYAHPDDVDLSVGGHLERGTPVMGPIFKCIISEQMDRTRRGDRFFFEFPSAGFTSEQLGTIRRIGISRLMCDNSNILTIQPRAFAQVDFTNTIIGCGDEKLMPRLNLEAWREVTTR